MTTKDDTVEIHIDGPDGEDQVTLPARLLDMLAEGEESSAKVVGDLALMSCAQRIHATVHHAEGEVDDELQAVEDTTLDLFEERFGMTFGEATGHQH
ncbi:DUF7545 family protein [Halomarina litorea]|uniref:DUF7545 family protein n=1 Tax=Halomarina litorea TaxID=2961595 RepID=UPI0020C44F06|nr:hypothetical protein [Halomarina sp. BCD28]